MPTSGNPASLRPKRSLGLVDLLAIGLNATVGSGVFLLPDDLFRAMGAWSPLAFLLCAALLLPVAWCFADASRRTAASGGPYEYARREFGERAGFVVGWMSFSNAVFSYAAVASAAAAYAAKLAPSFEGKAGTTVLALIAIGAFAALNIVGAKPGARAIALFTLGKFLVLFVLVGALVPTLPSAAIPSLATPPISGIATAVFLALFALQGFEVVGVPAGEAAAPERRVPLATLGTLLAASVLYVVVHTTLVFGFADLAGVTDAPLADAARSLAPSLGVLVAFGALVSTLGFVAGSALGTPRYLSAMAAQRRLPESLARLHPRFATPHLAIGATSLAAAALVLPFDYRTLIGLSNVAVAIQYASTCAAVFRFGLKERARRGRRLALAGLGLASSLAIWLAATKEELMVAASVLALGGLVGALTGRARARVT